MKKNPLLNRRDHSFSTENFKNPDASNAIIYNWVWNGVLSREETIKQLDEMQRMGIRAMYIIPEPKSFRPCRIPSLLEPEYMTKPYFEEYAFAIEEADKRGMLMMFYDEGGWPSGGACGKVLIDYPEYARQSLSSREIVLAKNSVYHMEEEVAGAFDQNGRMIEEGFFAEKEYIITEYFTKTSLFDAEGIPDFPDLTRKEATEAFIAIGIEPYKAYLKDYFGDKITATFTDEPTMPRAIAFNKDKVARFEDLYGYSIVPYLPELKGDNAITEQGVKARIDWLKMCSDLFCQNFLLTERKWANDNGMAFTGHMDKDDRISDCIIGGNYHVLRALRCFDIPGVDVIWRQIFPADKPTERHPVTGITCENRFFPRFASSAAAQIGSGQAITETNGVYGSGLTFDQMRYILNFQAIRGINVFNLFGVPYSRTGFHMTGELPFFTEKQACYKDLPVFNRYMERVSYINVLGKSMNAIGLYAPMYDIWAGENMIWYDEAFHKTGDELEDDRILFDIFDDDVLENADDGMLKKGMVCMGDACYDTLVLPPCKYIPEISVQKLETFISGGGLLYMVSYEHMPKIKGAIVVDSILGKLNSPVHLCGDCDKIRLAARNIDQGVLYMFHNEKTVSAEFSICDPDNTKYYYLLDLYTGNVMRTTMVQDCIRLALTSGEMAVLLESDTALPEEMISIPWEMDKNAIFMDLTENFSFRKSQRFVIGEKAFALEEITEKEQSVSLGDWSSYTGIGFSGSGIYKASFAGKLEDCVLDLGEVHYTCEAYLNGVSLGVRVMAPYTYHVQAELFKEQNTLEVRVSNTPANEYNTSKSLNKWPEWQLTVYWSKEKEFHKDSMSGGLYGPVKFIKTK